MFSSFARIILCLRGTKVWGEEHQSGPSCPGSYQGSATHQLATSASWLPFVLVYHMEKR